jgi:hypothetical protein
MAAEHQCTQPGRRAARRDVALSDYELVRSWGDLTTRLFVQRYAVAMGERSSKNRPLGGKFVALRNNLRLFGFAETLRAVLAHFHLTGRPSVDRFDRRHGVSTDGEIEVEDSDITGPSRPHAIKYQATHERVLQDVLAALPISHEDYVFVDLGSGKGRVLLAAAQHPFARVVGVELSPAYCEAARHNISTALTAPRCTDVEVLCGDVCDYALPAEKLVLYLFNPFEVPVLQRVLDRIARSLVHRPRDVLIAYCNPIAGRDLLEKAGFERLSETPVINPDWTWSLWRAC